MAKEDWATKKDVEEIVIRVVGEVVSTATTEILNVVADRFEGVDRRFDGIDVRLDHMDGRLGRIGDRLDCIENKLDPTIDRVDELTVQVKGLQAKTV